MLGGSAHRAHCARLSSARDHKGGSSPIRLAIDEPTPAGGDSLTEERDPYAVLGIASTATGDEVTAAYRHQARRHHPDVSRDPDAERRMAEINAAWGLLREPARRAAWDRAHGITPQVARRGPAAVTRPGGTGATTPPAAQPTAGRPADGGAAAGWHARPPAARPTTTSWRRGPSGEGAAGPPPGNPRGSVLPFGRHIGWSLGEIARVDPGYLVWLEARREGQPYREEIDRLLAAIRQQTEPEPARKKGGRFR